MFRRADDTSHTYFGELVEEGWVGEEEVVVAGQQNLVLGVEGETYQTFSAGRGTVGDTSLSLWVEDGRAVIFLFEARWIDPCTLEVILYHRLYSRSDRRIDFDMLHITGCLKS